MNQIYFKLESKLNGRNSRKVANNTYVEKLGDGLIGLRLHSTYVVKATLDYVEIDSGGWHTPTTMDRIRLAGVSLHANGKRGWSVYPYRECDCYCVTEGHPGKRFGQNPDTGEWDYSQDGCWSCNGTLKVTRSDWESGGYPYWDGMRLDPYGNRPLPKAKQPNWPDDWFPVVTTSGWSGLTRSESRAERNRQFAAMRSGDWETAFSIRDKLSGNVATLAPDRIEETSLGGQPMVATTYTMSNEMIKACPHFIFSPEHYRADGSCRCDDATHREMHDWGYVWKEGKWQ